MEQGILQKGDYTNAAQAGKPRYHQGHSKWPFLKSAYSDAFLIMYPPTQLKIFSLMQVPPAQVTTAFKHSLSALSRGDIQINPAHYCAL